MGFLFDTDTCISYFTNELSPIRRKFEQVPQRQIYVCSVVQGQLFYETQKNPNSVEKRALQEIIFNEFVSLPYDGKALMIYENICAHLARLGTRIGLYNSQIAAIALANDVTLVTRDTCEFSRVPELRIEDWETELDEKLIISNAPTKRC
jgi:tRNA(fMet)-specific endonuclease VapC